MLDAHDKVAVLTWSERQLGEAAKRAAIVELGGNSPPERVEKSSSEMQLLSCKPFLSVMADSIQHLSEAKLGQVTFADRVLRADIKSLAPAVH